MLNQTSGRWGFVWLVVLLGALAQAGAQCGGQWGVGDQGPLSGRVYAMTSWDPDGPGPLAPVLVAAGNFTDLAGADARNIAMWDGTAWRPIGTGVDGYVHALAVLPNG